MENSSVYIRSGFGGTLVSAKKPFYLPLFQTLQTLERKETLNLKGSLELGLLSKDKFFLDISVEIETITKLENEIILKAVAQGQKRSEILTATVLEIIRETFKQYNFSEISARRNDLESAISKSLESHGIGSSRLSKLEVHRTALDDYDLDNIIQFETAKEIVTRIARVQIKDKEFIDKCRKTISHFDIVDE